MPSRRPFLTLLVIALSASRILAQAPKAEVGPAGVAAKAWVIADGKTGKVLWGFHEAEPRAIASTTKIMTAFLALQLAEKNPAVLDEKITFSERAASIRGSSSKLRAGESLPVRELMYGMLLPSGNDAAVAMAEHFGPRFPVGAAGEDDAVKRFVAEMNRRAKSMNLAETTFRDPNGLARNMSSARDLATLTSLALKNQPFREYVKARTHEYEVTGPDGAKRRLSWKNTNQLLGTEGYDGVKTGTTNAAGSCLVASGRKGKDHLIVVVLGSTASDGRYEDARKLFRWAWEQPKFIRLAEVGRGFVLGSSSVPFTPWGLNYGHDGLIEDFWEAKWPTVVKDFQNMKVVGANVVRIHLQFGKFMDTADKPNEKSLAQLGRLLKLAEETGLYLDLTGLACYRKADVPSWYDKLTEEERWSAQAHFWSAIAIRCSGSPAVFCYDLMNEPFVPGQPRKPGDWYSGKPLGEFDFVQFIALDPRKRPREEIAHLWIKGLVAAIHKHDQRQLITVGLLPWSRQWGFLSGFAPQTIAPELDFISVHIYPETQKVNEALTCPKHFAVGKPVVIEETFPLACSADEVEDFLKQSRGTACGWMGHYDGMTIEQLDALRKSKTITLPQVFYLGWLELFRRLRPEMLQQPSSR
ncbi:MAG TPA: cellulase family glycosylhydrolase [Gemmataceae bacterium]|jgi:D-alanyl-D-alanine carboxypeptidase|nr:cellulase family glycosylhydrolase [Gemmataceae bacterium]